MPACVHSIRLASASAAGGFCCIGKHKKQKYKNMILVSQGLAVNAVRNGKFVCRLVMGGAELERKAGVHGGRLGLLVPGRDSLRSHIAGVCEPLANLEGFGLTAWLELRGRRSTVR